MCSAIDKDGGDVKALYRRSQALEKLGRLDQAVLDLQRCVRLEPKNKVFQEALRGIGGQIQEKVRERGGRLALTGGGGTLGRGVGGGPRHSSAGRMALELTERRSASPAGRERQTKIPARCWLLIGLSGTV